MIDETNTPEGKPQLHLRHDWYQTDTAVVITVLVRNIKEEHLKLDITENQVVIKIDHPEFEPCTLNLNLSNRVTADQSSYKLTPYKIEIKLKKYEGIRWDKVEGPPANPEIKTIPKASEVVTDGPPAYPSSKKGGKDWNKVEKEITEQETNEKTEGDEAVNKLFQEIYGKGSDEVKRAMNKSFMESRGTVLSTNWSEISKQTVEMKPPDGMEWKKFE